MNNLVKSAPALIALATVTDASKRGVRKVNNTLRCKVLERSVNDTASPELMGAVKTLVQAGHAVRLFEGRKIWSAALAADGALSWTTRASRSFRKHAVVEISL